MKPRSLLLSLLSLLLTTALVPAAITVPGADGSDGALVIDENAPDKTVIDLSLATTAAWDADYATLGNPVDFAGKGVYDAGKWAVVFRYSSVSIAAGKTVTFKNHPSRAPVMWLVNGDVTIAGRVSLNGQGYLLSPTHAEPGPGGFRGQLEPTKLEQLRALASGSEGVGTRRETLRRESTPTEPEEVTAREAILGQRATVTSPFSRL